MNIAHKEMLSLKYNSKEDWRRRY